MTTKDSKDYSAQVAKLKTVEECRGWIKNAKRLKLESAEAGGWLRLGQLLALKNVPAAASELDLKIDAAIRLIDERRGTRSNYTWRKIKQVGYIRTVEETVTKPTESQGFRDAIRAGLVSIYVRADCMRSPGTVFARGVSDIAEPACGPQERCDLIVHCRGLQHDYTAKYLYADRWVSLVRGVDIY
jgi:hypothetical protein